MQVNDRVAYTDAYFLRSFGVLQGCRSRDWATGRVVATQSVDGIELVRVHWTRAERPSDWLRANALEKV
jgi:hypothetical protein